METASMTPNQSKGNAMSETLKPLGYEAAAEDWNEAFAHRPMEMRDWTSLTFGEQARYAQAECRTKGAVYKSKITPTRVHFEVELPPSLALHELTEEDAGRLERELHRAFEKKIADYLQLKNMLAICAAEAQQ
jgi:hypothetical protein